MKYKEIYVALDNSELSNAAMQLAVEIGRHDGAELFGSHVYAARLHDQRFRMMESGLPEPYQVERELERQRNIHDSLITRGLELISDSYLGVMKSLCEENHVPFKAVSLEGKNWQELVKDIHTNGYDLVALGAHGMGRVSGSLLGTVTERVLRRVKRDLLICRKGLDENHSERIVVCLDGSPRSWGALMRGIHLARAFGKKLTAVSVFDPHFHHVMFGSLNTVLSDKARKVFKFEEQEKLHEEIIDSGLAKIYQAHLDIASRVAEDADYVIETRLLDGKAFQKIIEFVREDPPWLLLVGRLGIHSDEEMDVGGNTENLCRLANCNILVTDTVFTPSSEYLAQATVTWSKEAESRMEAVPEMFRGMARQAVQDYCLEQDHTVVTSSVLTAAMKKLLPPSMMARMGIHLQEGQEEKAAPDPEESLSESSGGLVWTEEAVHRLERVPEGFMRHSARRTVEEYAAETGIEEISLEVAEQGLVRARKQMAAFMQGEMTAAHGKSKEQLAPRSMEKGSFVCTLCGYVVDGKTSQACSSCDVGTLQLLSKQERKAVPEAALTRLEWDEQALEKLERIPAGFMRTMTRCRIEQWARKHSHLKVTVEVVEAKYENWKRGSSGLREELNWSDDARKRMEKIPNFVRPMVMREIENALKSRGESRVDNQAVDAVLARWGDFHSFHQK